MAFYKIPHHDHVTAPVFGAITGFANSFTLGFITFQGIMDTVIYSGIGALSGYALVEGVKWCGMKITKWFKQ